MNYTLLDLVLNIIMTLIFLTVWDITSTKDSNMIIVSIITFIVIGLIQLFINGYWEYISYLNKKKEKQ